MICFIRYTVFFLSWDPNRVVKYLPLLITFQNIFSKYLYINYCSFPKLFGLFREGLKSKTFYCLCGYVCVCVKAMSMIGEFLQFS